MFDWIGHNKDMFLVHYTEIGHSHQMAVELEAEHSQFANSAVVGIKEGIYEEWFVRGFYLHGLLL